MSDQPRIGYIGLGLMGSPMATRLLADGYDVTVWGRTPAKLESLHALGARRAESPASLASNCDIVFLCLSDTAAVEDVVFGSDGIVRGARAGSVLVDMSSIEPARTVEMAAALTQQTGAGWVDAPVSGGVGGATDGTLAIMCGASQSDFDRVAPTLAVLGNATRMGETGSGQNTKLVNQLIVACTMTIVAEATAFASAAGVDVSLIPSALAGGRADSPVLQQYMERMAIPDGKVESYLHTIVKDMGMIQAQAAHIDTQIPMLDQARAIHNVVMDRGLSEADNSRVYDFYSG